MGMREGFENFVIDELGPYALTGGAMSIYEAVKKAWQAATLQAAERMKEEAAKVCNQAERSPWAGEYEAGYVAGYNSAVVEISKAIRAIDVNKLFGE